MMENERREIHNVSPVDIAREIEEMIDLYTIRIGMTPNKDRPEISVVFERDSAADALLKEYPEYIAVETQMSDVISMAVSSYYRNLKKLEESSR